MWHNPSPSARRPLRSEMRPCNRHGPVAHKPLAEATTDEPEAVGAAAVDAAMPEAADEAKAAATLEVAAEAKDGAKDVARDVVLEALVTGDRPRMNRKRNRSTAMTKPAGTPDGAKEEVVATVAEVVAVKDTAPVADAVGNAVAI